MFRTLACAPLVLAAALLSPNPARADRVDDFVREQLELRHVPGLSLAVVRDGKLVRAKGYGLANAELGVPATKDTVYELASVTKQFTATAIMLLVDEGKLSLDDRITDRLPGLPDTWKAVTVRHLLNHTSGIPSYTGLPGFMEKSRQDFSHAELIGLVSGLPLEFAPGERWDYNNTGYFLLGMLIEKTTGKPYGTFVKERIFDPLGMASTRVNSFQDVIKNRAAGYTWSPKGLQNAEYVSPTQPYSAGALVSTVEDMAKWGAALEAGTLVKPALLEQMWTPTRLNNGKTEGYGFGWAVETFRTRKRISHGGGIPGFSTNISRFPEDRLTVVVLANSSTAAADTLAAGIAAFYSPTLEKNAPKPIADADPSTTAHLREIVTGIAAGKLDRESLAEPARTNFTPDRVQGMGELLRQRGALSRFELMEEGKDGDLRLRRYRATFGGLDLRFVFFLNAEGKIARLGVQPE